jgi:hypothetical protein
MKRLSELMYTIFCLLTAMIGYYKHGSIFWTIIDFIFAPLVWCKWLLFHQINISIIKNALGFFLK